MKILLLKIKMDCKFILSRYEISIESFFALSVFQLINGIVLLLQFIKTLLSFCFTSDLLGWYICQWSGYYQLLGSLLVLRKYAKN